MLFNNLSSSVIFSFVYFHLSFVFLEQITMPVSDTFLINIKVNFLNFVQFFSNGTPCISTFFGFWIILIRLYRKYFSAQVNIIFIIPSHRWTKKKTHKNLNAVSRSQLFPTDFGVHELYWLLKMKIQKDFPNLFTS